MQNPIQLTLLTAMIAGFFLPAWVQAQSTPSKIGKTSALACNRLALSPAARKRHFDTLGPALRNMHQQVRELPDGFEFEFPSDSASVQQVSEWADGERLCCPFFQIDLRFERENGGFWLRLTGGDGVKQFIKSDFARWLN